MEIELIYEEMAGLGGGLLLVKALVDGNEAFVGRNEVTQELGLNGRFTRIRVDLAKKEE